MENINVKQIEATLNDGRIFTGIRLTLLYIFSFISIPMFVVTIATLVCMVMRVIQYDIEIIVCLIIANFFTFFVSSICIYSLIRNKKNLKKVELCLQKCIKVVASAKRLDIENPEYRPYQIEVIFEINGKKYRKLSKSGNPISGYNKFYKKYCRDKFEIAYSKEYDEVLILKK